MPETIINAPEGRIEARYHINPSSKLIALVLHPHPEHGGNMNDKVTYALYRTFVDSGFNTLRFNFRGIGKSEGKFSNGEGEISDTATVLDWMQTQNPNASSCWIAGFSFGAWIGMQLLMRRPEINNFISVSPPVNIYDFNFLAPCPAPGLIIKGNKDKIIPTESIDKLVEKISLQRNIKINYKIIEGADYLYTNKINDLIHHVKDYLDSILAPAKLAANQ